MYHSNSEDLMKQKRLDLQPIHEQAPNQVNLEDSSGSQISTMNMNMSYICGFGANRLFDWDKSKVMDDVHMGRRAFEIVDKNGKASPSCYNEEEIYHMIDLIGQLTSAKSDSSSEKPKQIRGMFKRSFHTLAELMNQLN
jgi:hypothetical protein